jgi:hypothetical protein
MPEVVPVQTALRVALVAVLFAGCSGKGTPDGGTGSAPPNICNAQSDAQTETQCQLTLAAPPACFYMDHVGKTLWLQATMPATLNAQSLLEIEASYSPSSGSPVELSLDVVTAAQASVASGQNLHDPGAPGPINIVTTPPASLAGQPVFFIITDASNTHYDINNEFCVTVNVVQDPDQNQAGVPTAVTLSAGAGGVQTNTPPATGVLSTPGRVDEYSFTVDASIANPILYLSVVVPPNPDGGVLVPPIAYLMGYTLYDCGPSASASATSCAGNPPTVLPEGSVTATAHMPNVFLPVDLATSLLVKPGDMYVVEIAGVSSSEGDTGTVPGDIRVQYDLTLEEMPDLDPYDGTSTSGAPTPVAPSLGGAAVTFSSGRLSYVPQIDSFAINLPAQSANTRIQYLITPGTSGTGRFPALPDAQPRIATLSIPVPASTGTDPGQACNDDYDTCPNDTPNLSVGGPASGLPEEFCELDGGPQCLYSYRQEDPDFPQLGNFEGIIPVKAGTTLINFAYEWQGGQGADDVPYTLSFTWLPEGAENQTPPYHWTPATAIQETLYADVPTSGSFPVPPAGATTLTGTFTIGDSLTDNSVATVRGINDYDAVPSTLDIYQLNFPSVPNTTGNGATWELQWSVQNSGPGGTPPVTLEVAPFFCTVADGTTTCMTQESPDPFAGLALLDYNTSGGTWYGQMATVWDQTVTGGYTVDTVEPGGCFCFQPSYLSNGSFLLYVIGVNRTAYVDANYTITTAITTYPQSNGDGDGGICQWSDAGIPDGGTEPITTGCQMVPSAGCGGGGSQCLAAASCCSQSCNFLNPCPPGTMNNNLGDGGYCGLPGYGYCN